MNRYTICLGSNCAEKEARLADAAQFLTQLGNLTARSGAFLSEPEFSAPGPLYLNEVLEMASAQPYDALHSSIKTYETALRSGYHGQGVCIDIDIVVANGECLRPADASAHYFRTGLARLKTL
ncbi:MAG: hypothetical protein HDS72_05445 [Bacteroidales bacterium]|nr:hypothetical protein [Bacteroidales bacterium]